MEANKLQIEQLISFYEVLIRAIPKEMGMGVPEVDFNLGNNRLLLSPEMQDQINVTFVETRRLHLESTCFVGRHGVYIFFNSLSKEVIYIGKAEKATISERVWSFFRTAPTISNETCTFPNLHRRVNEDYAKDKAKAEEIVDIISRGHINVVGIRLEPAWYASFFEAAGLTYVMNSDGKLPPINLTF